jgi:plasmid stabilization system protein ParE
LIGFTARAARQFRDLREHYEDLERPEAVRGLIAALDEASRKIAKNPAAGSLAPRPYPHLARPGRAWIKAGRYWISYSTTEPPLILGIFYETANIPRRL